MVESVSQRPAEPLVARNLYRTRRSHSQSLAPFSLAKDLLPVPILPDHPDWIELYWRTWEMVWSALRRPGRSSSLPSSYVEVSDDSDIFMWDTVFTVQFGVYGRRAFPFVAALDNFYAKQHEDGAICRQICADDGSDRFTPFDPDSTGPNTMAWAEWRHYRISGDESRLASVFWPLVAYHRWMRANRSWPSGLYWATGSSSGMVNQPRIPGGMRHHQHWSWVDASMQASISCRVLERLARLLDELDLVTEFAEEHALLKRQINERMWNEETRFYHDVDPKGHFSPVKSIGAYWSLVDGLLIPDERIDGFVRHLREKDEFKKAHRVPSMSADSDGYRPETGDHWCGGVWAPTNFMVLQGLHNVGQNALAHEIACNHLRNIVNVFEHTDTLWEYYAPEASSAGNDAKPNYAGWGGLTAIAMLLEDVIGLRIDWPLRQVVWNRHLDTSRHYGVQNYPLGSDGTLSLMGDAEQVVVTTDVPFTLTIRDLSMDLKVPVSIGKMEIDLV